MNAWEGSDIMMMVCVLSAVLSTAVSKGLLGPELLHLSRVLSAQPMEALGGWQVNDLTCAGVVPFLWLWMQVRDSCGYS